MPSLEQITVTNTIPNVGVATVRNTETNETEDQAILIFESVRSGDVDPEKPQERHTERVWQFPVSDAQLDGLIEALEKIRTTKKGVQAVGNGGLWTPPDEAPPIDPGKLTGEQEQKMGGVKMPRAGS